MTVSDDTAGRAGSTDVEELPVEEGRRLLDEAAQRNLNMSGDQFIAAWDRGRFSDPDSLRVQQVAALLPFAR